MSTAAIDTITSRTSERLTAFKSRIEENIPIDNIFVDLPTFNELWKRRKTVDGGRQTMIPLDTAQNSTVGSFTGYDTFNTTPQDTARPAVYAFINYGGTATISWEEMRETANSDVRVFDLVEHKRNSVIKSMKDRINSDLFATTPASNDINSLPFLVTTTGTVGGIDSSSNTWWRAQENTTGGAFSANGLTVMRDIYNDIVRQGQGKPNLHITTQSLLEAYESEIDVDVRYSDPSKLSRGALELEWKGAPIMLDADCPSGHVYSLNLDHIYLYVDEEGEFDMDDFIEPANQKVFTAKVVFRGQLVTPNRRTQGRATGLT